LDSHTKTILVEYCMDIETMLRDEPEKFNFGKLGLDAKLHLLREHFGIFASHIRPFLIEPEEKIHALCVIKKSLAKKYINVSEEELMQVNDEVYSLLVNHNCRGEYLRLEKFLKMKREPQRLTIVTHPSWALDHVPDVESYLTSGMLRQIINEDVSLIDKITDFSKLSTCWVFWRSVLRHNINYVDKFFEYNKNVVTKTDVRVVVREFPEIIKMLDTDRIEKSKLNVKEWALLIQQVMSNRKYEKFFRGFEFSKDFVEFLKLEASYSILSGAITGSTRTRSALKLLTEKSEIEDINSEAVNG